MAVPSPKELGRYVLLTPATEPAISLADLKEYLGIPVNDRSQDTTLETWAAAAVAEVERKLGLVLLNSKWSVVFDCFPLDQLIIINRKPIETVDMILYTDPDGAGQTITYDPGGGDFGFQLDRTGRPSPRILPNPGETWPTTQVGKVDAVHINMDLGYDDIASIPTNITNAMYLMIERWIDGDYSKERNMAIDAALRPADWTVRNY
jgi:uncharacterized phiE125 gp8 family phage protein